MELLRGSIPLCCLSVDKSRDTVKNIFTSLTVIMLKRKIGDKLSKLYLKLKHFLHWFEKYLFGDHLIFEPEVLIRFRKVWWNWAFSSSYSKYGHMTHHFVAFLLLITISTFLERKNTQKPKIAKLIFFWIFSKWRHSHRTWQLVVLCMTKWPNGHFWSHFSQKTYSWGILNIVHLIISNWYYKLRGYFMSEIFLAAFIFLFKTSKFYISLFILHFLIFDCSVFQHLFRTRQIYSPLYAWGNMGVTH